ncbi:MAG: barstar family protein [Atopobiaceae bacterium]|nr:barstar family protein [Atopobiaceae bacterium]MDO4404136.1 barstar family protein [Atopobiaceae bacterium]
MDNKPKMRDIYEVPIDERDLLDMNTIHDYLRVTLGLPEYYGKNLDALQDCLGDIDTPTRLYVMRDASADPASEYAQEMDKLCLVLLQAARENEMLSVSINTVRWPD